ncbi:GntR family transcriptional regulator [Variovorax ureilyticus]|uniref:GntR family transcriptional regulator n=1 Tax=Variovorax ureilyticus TaxID=1836198 RepID=A0ABU8VMN0_9BURK
MEKIASRRQSGTAEEPSKRARGSVPEEVFQRLRRGLMVGAFVPGQVMSLRKLAASFGTSPMPIREALTRLVVINALEDTSSGSVRVPRLTPKKLNELFALRELVEGMATEMACRNCTPALLKSLNAINVELLDAIGKRNLIGCLSSNQRFHFTLYEAAGSEVIMPVVESLWLQFGPTMYLSLLSPDMPWDASAHVEILEGLEARKPAIAKRGVLRDIRNTAQSLEPALAELEPANLLSAPLDDLYFGT